MPLAEENCLSSDPPLALPVVLIGNGPSGICLSYMLSGYRPYVSSDVLHPNPILHSKLEEARHLSIPEQHLEYLSEGLEGRSSNPVAVLFDTLLHPNADFGYDYPSVLEWKLEPERYIPHIVLGKGSPGGAWHDMEGSILTLSLGDWMELPGLKFKDWVSGKRRNVKSDRATPAEVAAYYKHYVKSMGIQRNFVDRAYISSVVRPYREQESDCQDSEDVVPEEPCIDEESGEPMLNNWEVHGYRRAADGSHQPFCLFAEAVILATGTFDAPARLEVHGEDLPFVSHSIADFEEAVSKGRLTEAGDPVLIVGAGLTAADAILCAHNHNIPVIHAFRRRLNDPNLFFKQLPKKLYPEYHKVYHMMCTQVNTVASNAFHPYISYPEHVVLSFKSDKMCVLQSTGGNKKDLKVSMALVLIGSHPNLFFLKEQGCNLGHHANQPITCKGNPVEIDPYTYESTKEPNLFALGPLVGDNFIRFLKGGALAITRCLELRRQKRKRHRLVETENVDGGS